MLELQEANPFRVLACRGSSDAHDPDQFAYLDLGVAYARRGWLEASDALDTRSWTELERLLRR